MEINKDIPYISKFIIQRDKDDRDTIIVTLGYRDSFIITDIVKETDESFNIGKFKLYKDKWPNLCHLIDEFSNGLYGCDIFVLKRPLNDEGFIKTLDIIQNIHIKRMLEDEKMFNR